MFVQATPDATAATKLASARDEPGAAGALLRRAAAAHFPHDRGESAAGVAHRGRFAADAGGLPQPDGGGVRRPLPHAAALPVRSSAGNAGTLPVVACVGV